MAYRTLLRISLRKTAIHTHARARNHGTPCDKIRTITAALLGGFDLCLDALLAGTEEEHGGNRHMLRTYLGEKKQRHIIKSFPNLSKHYIRYRSVYSRSTIDQAGFIGHRCGRARTLALHPLHSQPTYIVGSDLISAGPASAHRCLPGLSVAQGVMSGCATGPVCC